MEADLIHGRLLNWGRCFPRNRPDAKLGYPTKVSFVELPSKSFLVAELDGQHIEDIVSSLYVSNLGRATLYAYILKVEYIEKPDSHVSVRAKEVKKHFKCPCGERTYYSHLENAKKMVRLFAESIK